MWNSIKVSGSILNGWWIDGSAWLSTVMTAWGELMCCIRQRLCTYVRVCPPAPLPLGGWSFFFSWLFFFFAIWQNGDKLCCPCCFWLNLAGSGLQICPFKSLSYSSKMHVFFKKIILIPRGKMQWKSLHKQKGKKLRNQEIMKWSFHFIQGQHTLYVDKLFCSKSILMHTECTPSQRAAVNCVAKCPFSFHPNGFDSSRAPINTGGGLLQVLSAL